MFVYKVEWTVMDAPGVYKEVFASEDFNALLTNIGKFVSPLMNSHDVITIEVSNTNPNITYFRYNRNN